MSDNPFTPIVASVGKPDADNPAHVIFADTAKAAEVLWAHFDQLPGRAEAILAQRRLQEAMFWAGQSIISFVRS